MAKRKPVRRTEVVPVWSSLLSACRDMEVALFYPEGKREAERSLRKAVPVCAACPVRTECLEHALAEEGLRSGRYGIRGGLFPQERRSLARKRTDAARRQAATEHAEPGVEEAAA